MFREERGEREERVSLLALLGVGWLRAAGWLVCWSLVGQGGCWLGVVWRSVAVAPASPRSRAVVAVLVPLLFSYTFELRGDRFTTNLLPILNYSSFNSCFH